MVDTSDDRMTPATAFAEVGRHRHWFNDYRGRLDAARALGWSPVLDASGWHVRRMIGQQGDIPLWSYLCETDEAGCQDRMPR